MNPTFATTVGCLPGEVERSTKSFLRSEFGLESIDPIPLSTPIVFCSDRGDPCSARRVTERIRRSSSKSGCGLIAVVARASGDGISGTPDERIDDLCEAVARIASWSAGVQTIGLWIDETGEVDWLV